MVYTCVTLSRWEFPQIYIFQKVWRVKIKRDKWEGQRLWRDQCNDSCLGWWGFVRYLLVLDYNLGHNAKFGALNCNSGFEAVIWIIGVGFWSRLGPECRNLSLGAEIGRYTLNMGLLNQDTAQCYGFFRLLSGTRHGTALARHWHAIGTPLASH